MIVPKRILSAAVQLTELVSYRGTCKVLFLLRLPLRSSFVIDIYILERIDMAHLDIGNWRSKLTLECIDIAQFAKLYQIDI